ncbi:MAG: hypothetical protein AUJ57_02855 [Zetaproteobacteria bacterium CG1_02_53_45]|nr:MAG: hypothetical protein AUJ57_02855 [Zetaproteobacteria bacterium CG1_02_53_45]
MKKSLIVMAGVLFLTATQSALASENSSQHKPGATQSQSMQGDMGQKKEQMFLVKKEIDGFTVNFHVMQAKPGKEMGGSHDFMVKVEKDGAVVTDLTANSKVTHPNGKSESKMMMKMGDWYMAGYDLGHTGTHQLMVLFKTGDGAKHFIGVYYPEQRSDQQAGHTHPDGSQHEHH